VISVTIPNNFLPERTYAVQVVLRHLLHLPVTITPSAQARDYVIQWGGKTVVIEDGFFGKLAAGQVYRDAAFIPGQVSEAGATDLKRIIRIFGEDRIHFLPDRIECGVDLFAGAFFMLTRWEETLPFKPDAHGRYPADLALAVRSGFIRRPVVDEYAALLAEWLRSFGYPVPIQSFRVVPTCDVDHPNYWPDHGAWRKWLGYFRRTLNLRGTLDEIRQSKAVRRGLATDPFDRFDYLLDAASATGTRFTFYFLAGGQTRYDARYKIGDPAIRKLIDHVRQAGHSIGLHPSYDAGQDEAYIAAERSALEQVTGQAITASRQHYLRFSVPETWRRLAAAGIREDSTAGYAAEPGFRCGTCKPFPVFDVVKREVLDLIERPLLVMDVSLRWYKQLAIPGALALCREIKDQVRKHDGEFVFLWHNSNLSEVEGWSGWTTVFEYLIEP